MAQELDENFKSVSEEVQSEISFRIIFFFVWLLPVLE